jgi:MarR family transcriptional regulator, multiple antibiotic resistance protein MarR
MTDKTPADHPAPAPFYTVENYQWQASTGHLIAHAHVAMRRALDAELARFGDVSSAQWIVMMVLAYQNDDTAANLAKRLNYDPGSMTRLLDRMQEKGLLKRARLDDDRRCIKIELTDAGRELAPSLTIAAINVINQALAGFSTAEHQLLNGLLKRMMDNFR